METIEEPIRVASVIGRYIGGGVEAVTINYYRNIVNFKL